MEKYTDGVYQKACAIIDETKNWVKNAIVGCVEYDDFISSDTKGHGIIHGIRYDKNEVRGGAYIELALDRIHGYCIMYRYEDGWISTKEVKTSNFGTYDYFRSRTEVVEFASWLAENWATIQQNVSDYVRRYKSNKEVTETNVFKFRID